jgi:YbgC/YbaW family acyl-CoA thioester hydrolase
VQTLWERGRLDGVLRRVPLTLRRRVHWGDTDTAQIGYTAKFVDFALEAAEYWWESVLDLDWYALNVDKNLGVPMGGMRFDFQAPVIAGERLELSVRVARLGRSSLTLTVEGVKADGRTSFTAEMTQVLVDRAAMQSVPLPDAWRRRIEGYEREVGLQQEGVRTVDEIVDFWFGAPGSPERGTHRPRWFRKDEGIDPDRYDAEIRERFLATYEAAAKGALDHWLDAPDGALALLLVLDQFPRNMFRGTAHAYATDEKARAAAAEALATGHDRSVPPAMRLFFYLPYEHSELLADQERAIELFRAAFEGTERGPRAMQSVRRHHEIVARFGRFPHRNAALGRDSTPEEIAFLQEPNSSF